LEAFQGSTFKVQGSRFKVLVQGSQFGADVLIVLANFDSELSVVNPNLEPRTRTLNLEP
jgi:hypothetical protein